MLLWTVILSYEVFSLQTSFYCTHTHLNKPQEQTSTPWTHNIKCVSSGGSQGEEEGDCVVQASGGQLRHLAAVELGVDASPHLSPLQGSALYNTHCEAGVCHAFTASRPYLQLIVKYAACHFDTCILANHILYHSLNGASAAHKNWKRGYAAQSTTSSCLQKDSALKWLLKLFLTSKYTTK